MKKILFTTIISLLLNINFNLRQNINDNTLILNTSNSINNIITITEVSSEIIVPIIITRYYIELQNNGYHANYIEDEWLINNFSIVYNSLLENCPELNMIDYWEHDNIYNDYSHYKIINREKLFENIVISSLSTENYIYESNLLYTIILFEIEL